MTSAQPFPSVFFQSPITLLPSNHYGSVFNLQGSHPFPFDWRKINKSIAKYSIIVIQSVDKKSWLPACLLLCPRPEVLPIPSRPRYHEEVSNKMMLATRNIRIDPPRKSQEFS